MGNQIGFLLLPTLVPTLVPMLVPMLVWLYLERSFVITVAVEGAMAGTVSDR